MNFLAHAYLSFDQPEILVGNMISDFVKGKKKFDYSAGIQKGISLHRSIDEFTDTHAATKQAKEFFRPAYRLYSGAFIDVVYDHFLACDENEFSIPLALKSFSKNVYQVLEENFSSLPKQFQSMLPHMKNHDWLFNYQFPEGLQKSFGGLVHRALYINDASEAFIIFNKNYNVLRGCYQAFFPDVKKFAADHLSDLLLK